MGIRIRMAIRGATAPHRARGSGRPGLVAPVVFEVHRDRARGDAPWVGVDGPTRGIGAGK